MRRITNLGSALFITLFFTGLLTNCMTPAVNPAGNTAGLNGSAPVSEAVAAFPFDFDKSCIERSPAQAQTCSDVFATRRSSSSEELQSIYGVYSNFVKDFSTKARLKQIVEALRRADQFKSAIPIDERLQAFRDALLPLMKLGPNEREAVFRTMEADLRVESWKTRRDIIDAAKNEKTLRYDLVITGSGVHGVIAALSALEKQPNLRVLIVDRTDTAASNFRYAVDTFAINSSNRKSGGDLLPLPGQGNINEIPGSPIQIADFNAEKYATAGDLGGTLLTGLYSAVKAYPNVEVVFNTEVRELKPLDNGDSLKLRFLNESENRRVKIEATKTIIATGLGRPNVPRGVRRAIRDNSNLRKQLIVKLPDGTTRPDLPKIYSTEEGQRYAARTEDPMSYYADKTIIVAGDGDSAQVFIEFLLGYGPRSGYGLSSAQTGIPKRIIWLGQTAETCEEFIKTARSRYARIGTGFRSSDEEKAPILVGDPAKLSSVSLDRRDKVVAQLENSTKTYSADHVVLATGFSSTLNELLENYGTKNDDNRVFLEQFGYLESRTSTSEGESTRVARLIAKNGSSSRDARIVIVGPSAGKLPQMNELKGIIQNTVSIFNNAPRSAKAAEIVVRRLEPTKGPAKSVLNMKVIKASEDFSVSTDESIRSLGRADEAQLVATMQAVFSRFRLNKTPDNGRLAVKVWRYEKGKIGIRCEGFEGREFVEALAATRDFFPSFAKTLEGLGSLSVLRFTIDPSTNSSLTENKVQLALVAESLKIDANAVAIENENPKLDEFEIELD